MEAAAMDPGVRFFVDDDFLNFNLPDVDGKAPKALSDPNSLDPAMNSLLPDDGAEEEELEWLNEGTFPPVEFGILSENPGIVLNQKSPVSVLENSGNTSNNSNGSSTITSCCAAVSVAVPARHPVRARSKRRRRRRRDLPSQQCWWSQEYLKNAASRQELPAAGVVVGSKIGRRCLHCQTDKTPQWRAGPMGPKTLCNACGVRYKSGRLVPEYRPASSPTFSSVLHSNSHRKIEEMRKKKQVGGGGGGFGGGMMVLNKDCEYRVG